ncbi:RND multidrug efflux transporter [Sporolactobacillus inulinus]|uniref:RND multidrug efflux transporter n=1 Tax=Sporolactobacillus inulinus TaxID=2078 RepID=A0A4Y1ZAG8_9BACL|nr:RND multidrug efflux transporter [Sporolactobacillus inulinus]
MRKIIAFSMKNKLAVWLLTLVVIIGGIYAGTNMKMETMPNFTIPVVSVSTVYQGASPDEVDNSVTEPIEQKLQALPGVQNVSATSSTGMSAVVVEYDYSKDMDKATDDIKEAVDQVSLPDQVSTPNVARISMDSMPVYSLSVSGKDMSLDRLSDRVEKDLLPSIQGVDGISSVTLSGQQTESVQISFKANQLKKFGLSQDTVVNLIKGNNVSAPLGLYTIDQSQKSIVVSGNIKSVNDLKDMRIPYTPQPALSGQAQPGTAAQRQAATGASTQQNAGQTQQDASAQADSASGAQQAAAIKLPTVKLSEVASVTLQKKAESISRTNGERSIGLSVVKGQDANTVDVVNDVKAKVAAFNKSYPDIQTESMFDQGQPIEQSVKTMVEKAIYGALFAMLIILLFLRNIRTTLISVISIPLSLLIALIVLKQMDITLNVMTLGAMTIAIGRVVDDSIVVIENIYRRMSLSTEKLRGRELIREATHEMFIPILSSTIVTIAVFLPMALVSGVVGQIFWPFALTIVFSLLASLLVAITIVPMLFEQFL